MLRVDEDGRMLFLHKNFCYIFSSVNGVEKPDRYRQKFLALFHTIARSSCCNVSLNIVITRYKYRIAFFYKFGSSRKQKQTPLEAEDLNFRALLDRSNQKKLKEAI